MKYDAACTVEERPFRGRVLNATTGRPLGPVAPLGLKPNFQIDRNAALKAPLFHSAANTLANARILQEQHRAETILHSLFPDRRQYRFSRAGSAAHSAIVPACALPGSCFRERGAELLESSRPPTVRASCLQGGSWPENPHPCQRANQYECRRLPARVLPPKPTPAP